MQIDRLHFREAEPHVFTAEASAIGLPPGEWPEQIQTKIGNGRPFIRKYKKVIEGEIVWVTYWQDMGISCIRVFND